VAKLDIRIGDRLIRPSENEQALAAAGAGALVLGVLMDSSWLKLGGALALGGTVYAVWEESQLFVQPETMNSYFQTGGATSALGPAPAPRGAVSYEPAASSPVDVSYDPGAAAPEVLADVVDIRRARRGRR
jgi:hypothetical protein